MTLGSRLRSSITVGLSVSFVVVLMLGSAAGVMFVQPLPLVVANAPIVSAASLNNQAITTQDAATTGQALPETQKNDIGLVTRLQNLEASLSRAEAKSIWLTPLITVLSVIIGGMISIYGAYKMQSRLLSHQERRAKFDWHVRQFVELYGPLHALFDGSNEVYRRMNEALIGRDPGIYRDLTLSGQASELKSVELDPDGRYFETRDNHQSDWRKFRMIMDWNRVYGNNLGVDGYFDRIVDIGTRISKLIQEKAGLVMPQHGELLTAFGKYVAHFEVLRELHAQSQSTGDGRRQCKDIPLQVREAAAFPSTIQKLVKEGAVDLLKELESG